MQKYFYTHARIRGVQTCFLHGFDSLAIARSFSQRAYPLWRWCATCCSASDIAACAVWMRNLIIPAFEQGGQASLSFHRVLNLPPAEFQSFSNRGQMLYASFAARHVWSIWGRDDLISSMCFLGLWRCWLKGIGLFPFALDVFGLAPGHNKTFKIKGTPRYPTYCSQFRCFRLQPFIRCRRRFRRPNLFGAVALAACRADQARSACSQPTVTQRFQTPLNKVAPLNKGVWCFFHFPYLREVVFLNLRGVSWQHVH